MTNSHKSSRSLPWKKMLFFAGVVFVTGFLYILQQYSVYFSGSILGKPKYVLDGFSCPEAGFAFEASPVPGLFSYRKGNKEANRKEMLRINKKNQGITSWFSYDKGFNESAKVQLIDGIAYEGNSNQYVTTVYNAIKSDKSPHGSVDFVTKWLSPENVNLPTVFPYSAGYVVEAVMGNAGYGNYVSVCSDLNDGSGKKLRVLYSVAHLDSLSVTSGQSVKAGDELGKIGTTGNSTTPHAHISIMPDLVWVSNYKEIYNAGYKFYYAGNIPEVLVKSIDPVSVILNPDVAYSIALDDTKRKNIFENAAQFITGAATAVVFSGGGLPSGTGSSEPQKVFTDFRLSASPEKAKLGESIGVLVEAVDQEGKPFAGFSEEIKVVLSSATAQPTGSKVLSSGKTTLQVIDSVPGEVIVQVSNNGSISEEKKIVFEAVVTEVKTEEKTEEKVEEEKKPESGENGAENTEQPSRSDVILLEGDQYRLYTLDGESFIVFNDREVTSEYPVEMKFTVPEGTESVSIFSGINSKYFPDTGELKLTKYTPGQSSVRYYPKYVSEDSYKKIVAYKGAQAFSEKIFTWSPASLHAFTDVVDGITDRDIYEAVKALKTAGVVKGNPDGSFGVEKPINRAGTATILIRAFYSDVKLEALKPTQIPFKDVPKDAWYASAMWFASLDAFEQESKPVIIKGYQGKANPDGNVKIEEFVTMLLRLLEIPLETTQPWYEGAVAKSIELGFITEGERKLIDQPLPRGMVAKILVKALKYAEENPVEEVQPVVDGTGGPVVDTPVVQPVVEKPLAAQNLRHEFANGKLTLTWESDFSGPFKVYRETVGGAGEILIGTTGGKLFNDLTAKAGKQYYYRVEYDGGNTKRGEILVSL